MTPPHASLEAVSTSGPQPVTLKRGKAYLYAVLSGLLIALAFPPFNLSPLGFLALWPLTLALYGQSARRRWGLGMVTGLVYQVLLFSWIPFTMEHMSGLPYAAGVGLLALYALSHSVMVGAWAWLSETFRNYGRAHVLWLTPLISTAMFAFIEWAFPMLFPWSVGHFTWEMEPLSAPLLAFQGVPWLTMVVLWPGAFWAECLLYPSHRRALLLKGGAAALACWALPFALHAYLLGEPERTLRVAVVQPNFSLEEKKRASLKVRAELFKRLERQLQALPRGLDLVMGSEGAYPLWWRLDASDEDATGKTERERVSLFATRRLQQVVRESIQAPLALGGLRHDEEGETRNSVVLIDEKGTILGAYDKQTLLPFGEYVPFAELFPALKNIPGIGYMVAGDSPCRFETHAGTIGCGICYETVFAGQTRRDLGDSELLLNMTIDTWFGTGTAPWLHLMTHTSRAAELGVPLLRASLTGISAVIDARGQVQSWLPLNEEGTLVETITLYEGTTLYRLVGQVATLAFMGFFIGLWMRHRWRSHLRHE